MQAKFLVGIVLAVVLTSFAHAELSEARARTACTEQGFSFVAGTASWDGTAYRSLTTPSFGYTIDVQGDSYQARYTSDKRVKAIVSFDATGTHTLGNPLSTGTIQGTDLTDLVFCLDKTEGGSSGSSSSEPSAERASTGDTTKDGNAFTIESDDSDRDSQEEAVEVPEFSTVLGGVLAALCVGVVAFRKK